MDETKYWVWLTMVFGSAAQTMWKAVKLCGTASDAYYKMMSGTSGVSLNVKHQRNLQNTPIEQAEEFIADCMEKGINIIGYSSAEYPESLRHIANPPPVLYYKGNISCVLQEKNITCVGTRNPSEYTLITISKICTELAMNGFTIVSGFAVGADIASHISAINANRPTACVLGCGIDVNYPIPNERYRNDVLKNGGVFISEVPPQTRASRHSFPQRNRILAALSRATIVFEAAEQSGSLNTAGTAFNQGREIFCVPPSNLFDERYAGNIGLLRTIANPLYSVQDIFDIYNAGNTTSAGTEKAPYNISDIPVGRCSTAKKTNKTENNYKKDKPEESVSTFSRVPAATPEITLTSVQRKILELIGNSTLHIDMIIRGMDMDISDIISEIMELQLNGIVEELPGSRFRKC